MRRVSAISDYLKSKRKGKKKKKSKAKKKKSRTQGAERRRAARKGRSGAIENC